MYLTGQFRKLVTLTPTLILSGQVQSISCGIEHCLFVRGNLKLSFLFSGIDFVLDGVLYGFGSNKHGLVFTRFILQLNKLGNSQLGLGDKISGTNKGITQSGIHHLEVFSKEKIHQVSKNIVSTHSLLFYE